jgi:hypothetical protein
MELRLGGFSQIFLCFRPVVGVFTNHTCVSTQTDIAYARVFGGDTNHGAEY